jgi:3-dehydroquinate synthase
MTFITKEPKTPINFCLMDHLQQSFTVRFNYKVFFSEHIFHTDNPMIRYFLQQERKDTIKKLLFVVDEGVLRYHTKLLQQIKSYFADDKNLSVVDEFLLVPGGENVKNDEAHLNSILNAINKYGIDRHSYVIAIGGGSVLDLVGFAAAIAHRGIRHIRIPTTVLAQNDSGIGVKNGINFYGKKNFLGTFAPPVAVFNDFHFLTTLSEADWRSGMSEAVKVALIKDPSFFFWLEENALDLAGRNMELMQYLIRRCAELHLQHIAGGDPFEMGSSRPLDFGHWSAHKLEQLTNFSIRHGEAVAMGIALDSAYSFLTGRIGEEDAGRILDVLKNMGFAITHPLMQVESEDSPLLQGLEEFREHLGGRLTITLLDSIGKGEEAHHLDVDLLRKASDWVRRQS